MCPSATMTFVILHDIHICMYLYVNGIFLQFCKGNQTKLWSSLPLKIKYHHKVFRLYAQIEHMTCRDHSHVPHGMQWLTLTILSIAKHQPRKVIQRLCKHYRKPNELIKTHMICRPVFDFSKLISNNIQPS